MMPRQYCTFFVEGQYYGLDAVRVQEILCAQRMTPVPLAPPMVRGLINLRGQIVMALDLRHRLGMKERPAADVPVNVVLQASDGAVSLLVDEIGDVVEAPQGDFERPPETLSESVRDMILGTYQLADRLLMVLDADEVVRVDWDKE
ncbi:MAG TPA: chemotaxis protein CheW [Gemmataceae bacterium]|nr:chemotaxis protein CheW [Gemmataceae bacterium]